MPWYRANWIEFQVYFLLFINFDGLKSQPKKKYFSDFTKKEIQTRKFSDGKNWIVPSNKLKINTILSLFKKWPYRDIIKYNQIKFLNYSDEVNFINYRQFVQMTLCLM